MENKNLCTIAGIFAAIIIAFSACNNTKEPNVSNVHVKLKTQRLDRDMAAIDTNAISRDLADLKKKYPYFLDFYLDTLMGFQVTGNYSEANDGIVKGVRIFLTYPDFRGLFDTIAKHYPDTKDIDAELKKGFQYLKYYYPAYPIPEIIYLNSNLNNYAAFTYDTLAVGIGLDMYLGEQYPFYRSVEMPDYVITRCRKEYIPVNAFKAIYTSMHPFVTDGRTLLDMMIQKGKEQYFLGKTLPFVEEHIRFGYGREQLKWCETSEAAIYNFFIDKQLLYSTNLQQVMRYITDGPNSAGMPPESPGSIGTWIGYRIVQEYVKKQENMTMQQLFATNDAQQILQQSKYKPK